MSEWPNEPRSTSWESSLNLISGVVSSGIVSFPFAIQSSGLILGIIIILIVALAIDLSIQLLIYSALEHQATTRGITYPKMMHKAFGRYGALVLSVSQLAVSFGGVCVDLIMVGDNLSNLVFNLFAKSQRKATVWIFLSERYFLLPLATFFFVLPLSMIRHVRDFAKVSLVAVAGSVLLVAGVGVACLGGGHWSNNGQAKQEGADGSTSRSLISWEDVRWFRPHGTYDTVSVACFAFICHGIVFSVYNSLRVPSMSRFGPVLHWSFALCYMMFMGIGVPGYLRFGEQVDGNILNNFEYDDPMANVLRSTYTVSLVTSIPLDIFVMRQVVQHYLRGGTPNVTASSAAGEQSNWVNFLISAAIVFAATLIAVLKEDVRGFLNITGGLAGTCIGLIFPAACYLKVTQKPRTSLRALGAYVVFGFGFWVFGYSLIDSARKLGSLFERRIVKF